MRTMWPQRTDFVRELLVRMQHLLELHRRGDRVALQFDLGADTTGCRPRLQGVEPFDQRDGAVALLQGLVEAPAGAVGPGEPGQRLRRSYRSTGPGVAVVRRGEVRGGRVDVADPFGDPGER